MAGISAVSINDNFAACQTAVAMRSSDYEPACRVDKESGLGINHSGGQNRIKHMAFNILMNLFLGNSFVMLCGQDDCIKADRRAFLIILHRYLCLAVRAQIRKCSILSHLGKTAGQHMRHINRVRHVFFRLICRISEHHTLIACSDCLQFFIRHLVFFGLQSLVHSHGNISRLLVDGCNYTAGVTVKTVFSPVISNLTHCFTHNFLNIHIRMCGDLTHNHNKACRCCCLAGNAAHRILCKQSIQDSIGNLIAHFIRMSLGN